MTHLLSLLIGTAMILTGLRVRVRRWKLWLIAAGLLVPIVSMAVGVYLLESQGAGSHRP